MKHPVAGLVLHILDQFWSIVSQVKVISWPSRVQPVKAAPARKHRGCRTRQVAGAAGQVASSYSLLGRSENP
jgi:hypothetical protein